MSISSSFIIFMASCLVIIHPPLLFNVAIVSSCPLLPSSLPSFSLCSSCVTVHSFFLPGSFLPSSFYFTVFWRLVSPCSFLPSFSSSFLLFSSAYSFPFLSFFFSCFVSCSISSVSVSVKKASSSALWYSF